jgi:hypothetical protein
MRVLNSETRRTLVRPTGTSLFRAIASIAVLAMCACAESTSPEESAAPPRANPENPSLQPTSPLGVIGATLPDATDWVLTSLPDNASRETMRAALRRLSQHLVAEDHGRAKQAVASLREMLSALSVNEAVELGPIAVALDQIDFEFGRLSQ